MTHTNSTFAPTLPVILPENATDRDVKVAMKAVESCARYYEWLMQQAPHAFNMPTHPPTIAFTMPTHPPADRQLQTNEFGVSIDGAENHSTHGCAIA